MENQEKINKIIDNLGYERYLLSHLKKNYKAITYDNEREIFDEIMENENIINEIQKYHKKAMQFSVIFDFTSACAGGPAYFLNMEMAAWCTVDCRLGKQRKCKQS